jgi:flagellar basal body-associated protein FliL
MGTKVLVPLLVLTTAAALGALVFVARDGTAAASSTLNLDKAKLPPSQAGAGAGADPDPAPETAIAISVVARLPAENGDRYVKTSFELQLVRAQDRDDVLNRMPQIRDAMITYFLDCSLEDVTGSAGLERTKQGLLRRLQRLLPQPLRALYVTDFVVAM